VSHKYAAAYCYLQCSPNVSGAGEMHTAHAYTQADGLHVTQHAGYTPCTSLADMGGHVYQ